jgi:hypothetical protein
MIASEHFRTIVDPGLTADALGYDRPMSGLLITPALPRRIALGLLLALGAGSVACGEDVLVARFGLTSNAPDAGVIEAAADAGKVNGQSINAQRARQQAKKDERANEHAPDDDH